MEGSDSRSASSIAKGSDDISKIPGKASVFVSSSKTGSDGIENVLAFDGVVVAALSEDVRVVIEKVLPVGDLGVDWVGDVFGRNGSIRIVNIDDVGEHGFGDGPGGLRRALRSGIGGGEVMGSGFSIGVSKEKLFSESGVAGGEGGRSGAKACAANGILPYRSCGIRRGCPKPFKLWESLYLRTAEARMVSEEV